MRVWGLGRGQADATGVVIQGGYRAATAQCSCQNGGVLSGTSAMGRADDGIVRGGHCGGVMYALSVCIQGALGGTGASETLMAKPTAFDVNVWPGLLKAQRCGAKLK